MNTNYPTKKLGEVCEVVGGGTPSTKVSDYWGNGYFWVTPKDLGQIVNVEVTETSKQITESGLKNSSAKLLPVGSVILSSRAPIGYVAININPMATNQGCRSFVCGPDIFNKYLYHFLMYSRDFLQTLGSGSTFLEVSGSRLREIKIPLPPVAEQKRIVAKIEKQFAKIDEAAHLHAQSEALTAGLLPATLHEIFSSAESKGWEEKEISEVCEKPQYGFTASASREKIGPKLLRITDIQDGGVDWETVPYCKCDSVEKYQLKTGDLVFARTGATVGKSFLIRDVPDKAVFASYLIRLRSGKNIAPEFLYYYFQSPDYWRQISAGQVGMAQPNVNGTKLAKLKIPLPPLTEQKAIVKKLDALAEYTRALSTLQSSQSLDLKALKQSILREAFGGRI